MPKTESKEKNEKLHADMKFVLKIACYAVAALIGAALLSLLFYSFVAVANAPFCPSAGGNNKYVFVTDDAMSPNISRGDAVTVASPDTPSDVPLGAIVAFRDGDRVLCRRVQFIAHFETETEYDVRADNDAAVTRIKFHDIIGVYTGDRTGGVGTFLHGVGSPVGLTITLIVCAAYGGLVAWYVLSVRNSERKKLEAAALERSIKELSGVCLRYDNICEITAVLDVLEMLSDKPHTRAERKEHYARLRNFIEAHTIELPQTPETAAVLDSLPAPDNPDTLAAALRAGATLRQAEDGQTLVLTGLSGGKSILLTPIQTPDGVMLCRQGVRIRAEIAPNLEQVGVTSMPSFPEFFEGQPLEKHVAYPELPSPHEPFGPDALFSYGSERPVSTDITNAANALPTAQSYSQVREITPHNAYNEYLALEAPKAKQQAKRLEALLKAAQPLTQSERELVAKYKKENAATEKPPKQSLTPEQKAERKAKSEQKKKRKEEFINSLSAEDKAKFEAEQNLKKVRAAAIRKLKKAEADRKILEKIKTDNN